MKKRISVIVTAAALVALIIVGGTLAFFTSQAEVNNVITIGDVKVTLTEPQFMALTDGTYRLDDVVPGQKIVKDPTITNTGDHDAYIRCTVTVSGDNLSADQKASLIDGLHIGSEKWVKSGDYYYYQDKLPKASVGSDSNSVKLFDTVTIPASWGSTLADQEFKINIAAEAIQAENFTPAMTNGQITGWQYTNGSNVLVESDAGNPAA